MAIIMWWTLQGLLVFNNAFHILALITQNESIGVRFRYTDLALIASQ